MIITMRKDATDLEIQGVKDKVTALGCETEVLSPKPPVEVIGVLGDVTFSVTDIEKMDGVASAKKISVPYKLVSREYKQEDTVITVGKAKFGGGTLNVIAGPCSVESEEQLDKTASYIATSRATLLRGGIVKPRTSPYAFQGMEEAGLELMEAAREKYDLPIVRASMSVDQVERFGERVDMIQIGARNMQNFDLLKACGKVQTPILLKRGLSATIEEWLMSAEYIAAYGNPNIIFCERGIRTFETAYRNVTDLNAVPYLKSLTHLPVVVDPSHATGIDWMVTPLGKAAIAVGCDGIIMETHYHPEIALSDGPQSLDEKQFTEMMDELGALHDFLAK